MTQNTSHAVMSQRAEPRDSLDFFPTPPWATRALCEFLGPRPHGTVWEPACGAGHMTRPLGEYFAQVLSSDVAADRTGVGHRLDFLVEPRPPEWGCPGTLDAIVTNPPFCLAAEFIRRALPQAATVAVMVRTVFLHGGGRWHGLWSETPPCQVLIFSERVPILRGRCLRKASTATDYVWLVWQAVGRSHPGASPRVIWIPPGTRRRLERPGDYDDDAPRGAA